MRKPALVFAAAIAVLCGTGAAIGDGAVSTGIIGNRGGHAIAVNRLTAEEAIKAAQDSCGASCQTRLVFKDLCVSVGVANELPRAIGVGTTAADAELSANNQCSTLGEFCSRAETSCDTSLFPPSTLSALSPALGEWWGRHVGGDNGNLLVFLIGVLLVAYLVGQRGIRKRVDYYRAARPARRALLIAVLAVLSGLLSNYVNDVFVGFAVGGVPVMPAIYFGIVLAVGCHLWAGAGKIDTFALLLATFVAWFAAFKTADWVSDRLGDFPSVSGYKLAVAGMAAGFVGSFLTAFGISLVVKEFRNATAWLRPVIVGTISGALLECLSNENRGEIVFHLDSLLPLFLVWQPAVAASIVFGLPGSPSAGLRAAKPGPP